MTIPPDALESLAAIAHEAGAAIVQARERGLAVSEKAPGEVLTSADLASHEVLRRRFAQAFPGMPVLSEEGADKRFAAGPMLVADELDGTAPFAAGAAEWAVMLAIVDREPTHGVIYLPDLGLTIAAQKGRGCTLNGAAVVLNGSRPAAEALLGADINRFLDAADWKYLAAAAAVFRAVRSTASAAGCGRELAGGVTHAYLNLRGGKIWDFAAIAVAVTEAGGAVSDPQGRPLAWNALPMRFAAASGEGLLRELLAAGARAA